jgi:hypothetical protein
LKDSGRPADQELCAHDGPERRKQRDEQRACSECGHTDSDQRTLGAQKINQSAVRKLAANRPSGDGPAGAWRLSLLLIFQPSWQEA